MNKFKRLESSVKALECRDKLYLEEALGMFLDLCEDIDEAGMTIDTLAIGSEEELLQRLSRSGRIFLNIFRKRAEEIAAFDPGGRIRKQKEKFSANLEAISQKEEDLTVALAELEQAKTREQRKKKDYTHILEQEKAKRRELTKLQAECAKMEEKIQSLASAELEPVSIRRQELHREYEEIRQQIVVEQEKLDEEKQLLEEEIRQKEIKNKDEKKKLEDRQKELKELQNRDEKEKNRLLDENNQLQEQLTILEKEAEEYNEKIAQMETQKMDMETRSEKAQALCKELTDWFKSQNAKSYTMQLEAMEEKTRLFREAQQKLFQETEEYGLADGRKYQEAREIQNLLQQQMVELEQRLESFRRDYELILGQLGD